MIFVKRSIKFYLKDKSKLKTIFYIIAAIIGIAIITLLLYKPVYSLINNPDQCKKFLNDFGIFGQLIFSLIVALQVLVAFLPGEPVEILAGYLYGPIMGMFLCILGTGIASVLIYFIVKKLGDKIVYKIFGKEKVEKISFLKNQNKLTYIMLIVFLIPGTPKDIFTYFMPMTKIKFLPFLIISTLARIPSVITSTLGGHALDKKQYFLMAVVFICTAVISLIGIWFYQNKILKKDK